MNLRISILGSGTSTGVPLIGCSCGVCTSTNPKNKRSRSSILITFSQNKIEKNILIDTSTDLRAQALAFGLDSIDAVLFTHSHADHLHGIDDLRAFNMANGRVIPCFGSSDTINRIHHAFDYIFVDSDDGLWKPELTTTVIENDFELFGQTIIPIELEHGQGKVLGFRIGIFAYLTDCSGIPSESLKRLSGVQLLVLGALRDKPHPSHFTISEAVRASEQIGAGHTYLTHLGHVVDYDKCNEALKRNVELAYDGLVIEC
jgi:phosphoribosyl 1,2-cyclic phosphate phosphodiesterase